MTTNETNVHHLPAKAPETPRGLRSPISLEPATAEQAVTLLSSCIALVRPAGMSDAEAGEWLTVAAAELAEYPQDIIASACKLARRTATHHSQIVPMLVAECDEALETRRFLARPAPPIPPARQIEPPPPYRPMTQAEVDKLPRFLVRLGIACGALVEDDNGNLKPAPE